jgi:hypothetical protein
MAISNIINVTQYATTFLLLFVFDLPVVSILYVWKIISVIGHEYEFKKIIGKIHIPKLDVVVWRFWVGLGLVVLNNQSNGW